MIIIIIQNNNNNNNNTYLWILQNFYQDQKFKSDNLIRKIGDYENLMSEIKNFKEWTMFIL